MTNNKIYILYATAGAGHKKAAEAIFNCAKGRSLDVELIDIIRYMPASARRLYSDGYTLLITRLVWLWTIFYYLSDAAYLAPFNVHLRRFLNAVMCRRLISFLVKERPSVVISTHFLASEIVSYVKQKYGINTKLITVVTDFEVHRFWLARQTDVYCCATDVTKEILVKMGAERERIQVAGIPVDPKFLAPQDKEKLLQEFGLKKDMFTVLVMTGGIGAGPIEEIVDLLKDEMQLLVVCGNNKQLFANIQKKGYANVRAFGFIDYIQKLMKISSAAITKAGGLTVTECLVMGLPMIFFYLIPGQEEKNAKTMETYGAGIIAKDLSEIKEYALKFKNDASRLSAYRNSAASLGKPDSSRQIIANA